MRRGGERGAIRPQSPAYWIVCGALLARTQTRPLPVTARTRLKAAYATAPASVALAERPAAYADLDRRLHHLEQEEEGLILESALVGATLVRRAGVSAAIVLCCVLAE